MSVTSVLVQLPSFSHSFSVSISSDSTILDFKNEITRTCVGAPSAKGQRVIYKGRVLNDADIVGEVWKTTDDPHTCHLAVHPSAWTATPPNNTSASIPSPTQATPPHTAVPFSRGAASAPPMPIAAPYATFSYIQYMHTNALRILARQPRIPWPDQIGDINSARAFAKHGIEATGRGWPPMLNQDFPISAGEPGADEGVKYACTYIDNLPYLTLLTPDAMATPLQSSAIRVLSYTFPLLCVHPGARTQRSAPVQVHPLPPRHGAIVPVAAALPQIPIRPLIVPLLLLTVRTVLLLYFFQPARKPLFGIMVVIWVAWEIAGAVRGALGPENVNGGQNNRPQGAGNGAPVPPGVRARAPGPGNIAAGGRPVNNNNTPRPAMNSYDAVLTRMARINLSAEAPLVEPDSTPEASTPAPGFAHKFKMFFTLLVLTLHPAIWDRRRTALRAREGRVRDEARTREARALQRERERAEREENLRRGVVAEVPAVTDVPEPLPPAPRPLWVAEYVQRVRAGDWVDD